MKVFALAAAALLAPGLAPTAHGCPYLEGAALPPLPANHPPLWNAPDPAHAARRWMVQEDSAFASETGYAAAAAALDWADVRNDVIELMHKSDPRWPSDYGNYGPLVSSVNMFF